MKTNYWKTSDINLAAFLSASGNRIEEIESDSPKSYLCFESSPKLIGLVNAYRRQEALVEPQAYWFHYQEIRKRILDT